MVEKYNTVNIDIFACTNFHGFIKMVNFVCIKILVFSTNDSLGHNDSNFHSVYIFADIYKRELSENIYKVSMFTVHYWTGFKTNR